MTLIKKEGTAEGLHPMEMQSHRTENWLGDEWIEVPEPLLGALAACGGYCDPEMDGDILTGITVREAPRTETAPDYMAFVAGLMEGYENE